MVPVISPPFLVLNKIDLLETTEDSVKVEELAGYYREQGFDKVVFISAHRKENIQMLKKMLFEEVKKKHLRIYPNYVEGREFVFE